MTRENEGSVKCARGIRFVSVSFHFRVDRRGKDAGAIIPSSTPAMIVRAPCKLNLTLDVFDKNQRTDGYHNLDSLVVPLSEPADHLRIRVEPACGQGSIQLTCNDSSLPRQSKSSVPSGGSVSIVHWQRMPRLDRSDQIDTNASGPGWRKQPCCVA